MHESASRRERAFPKGPLVEPWWHSGDAFEMRFAGAVEARHAAEERECVGMKRT
jgi:hypothetical protein